MTYKPRSLNDSVAGKEATPTVVCWPIRRWQWCTCTVSRRISFSEPLTRQHRRTLPGLHSTQLNAQYTSQRGYTSAYG